MQKIFSCSQASELEKLAKEKFAVPPFLMMENAARATADFILDFQPENLLILCGKGNNGGDGYAVARLLQNKAEVKVIALEPPAAEEARAQYEMCQRLGIEIISGDRWLSSPKGISKSPLNNTVILDCIYGTGFHGALSESVKKILDEVNKSPAIKIACDIPSGLYFQADYTITMGCQKLELYSDKAKAVCGQIKVADLGIARESFESFKQANTFLVEAGDLELPVRKNRAVHKGKFGHTAVLCGDKAGAAIIAATAAMNFGSGLISLVESGNSNLRQFKISPSLMISDKLPQKTSCLLAGSGFSEFSKEKAELILNYFNSSKAPAVVLDAGMLTSPESPAFLESLNKRENARIILTPHLSELSRLLQACKMEGETSVEALAEEPQARLAAGNYLTTRFPRTAVIMKSANTYIACEGETFVIADGTQSLAKGGSGDLLAGMAAALLAQGYTALSAAITAAEQHALTARKLGAEAYNLTPEKLISLL